MYKPSSLLLSYIADTSALPMLELGLMPVVTTMGKTRKNTPTRLKCPGWLLPTPPGSSNLHQNHHCRSKS